MTPRKGEYPCLRASFPRSTAGSEMQPQGQPEMKHTIKHVLAHIIAAAFVGGLIGLGLVAVADDYPKERIE